MFEAAEAAAAQYLENIEHWEARNALRQQEAEIKQREAETMAKAKAEIILADAKSQANKMITEASANAQTTIDSAKRESEAYWTNASQRLESFFADYQGLRELLSIDPKNLKGPTE